MDFSLNTIPVTEDQFEVNDHMIEFAQEMDMIFRIKPNELSSNLFMGNLNINNIINNRSISKVSLVNMIRNTINENTVGSSKFGYEVDVKFLNGKVRDIIYITTSILNPNGNNIDQTYIYR